MQKLNYIWFTFSNDGVTVAKKLQDEGNTVILAQIQDVKELKCPGKTEEAEDKKKRLAAFSGMIQKHDAKEVLRKMKLIENKDDWFIVFDLNSLWYYAQAAVKLGFNNGFFPTEEDTLFEDDRDKGKELVKKYWPDLEVAELAEFKTIDEGIAYLEEHADNMYVLKANTEGDFTVLPEGDDPQLARENLVGALETNKSDYETKGYILELKIKDVIEITPQIVFYNGKPVFTDIDIENKPIGAGSVGNMTGCAGNLIIKTELDDPINDIAFPPQVYNMAKKHKGMFIWDASLLIDSSNNKVYFGEFCPNRWGYDSFFTELSMCESVSSYFESIVAGKNPLKKDFGVAVRLMNLKKFADATLSLKGDEKDIYFYDVKMNEENIVSGGQDWALAVAAGASDSIEKAIDTTYANMARLSFAGGYYRPQFDFVSTEYKNSIPNRYNFTNGWLFSMQEWKPQKTQGFKGDKSNKKEIDKLRSQYQADLASIKAEMQSILDN